MSKSRIDKLTERLKGRTDRYGKALPGYAQNVAAIKAEIAMLTENLEKAATSDGN